MVAGAFWGDEFSSMLRAAAEGVFLLPEDSRNRDLAPALD